LREYTIKAKAVKAWRLFDNRLTILLSSLSQTTLSIVFFTTYTKRGFIPIFDLTITYHNMETPKSTLIQPLPVLIGATAQDMLNTFANTPANDLNRVPFEGSWTAGQLAEHIRLSLSSGIGLINGNTQATDRVPDKYVQAVKDLFLNFDLKFKAAPIITPEDKDYDKEALTKELRGHFNDLINLAQTKDLTDTCLAAEFYGIGYLTGLEWAYQGVYHVQRHIQQLKNIQAQLEVN
jgi:hypothetical protein